MNSAEVLKWFHQLAAKGTQLLRNHEYNAGARQENEASDWIAEAESALVSVFPAGHPCRSKWREAFEHVERSKYLLRNHEALPAVLGIFNAAIRILEADRLSSLLDGIRAETVSEVLDQAATLLPTHPVAAAVLAGGALETHLLHMCDRNGLTPQGDGSISKYDGAIAQARNAGTVTVYSVADTQAIKAWAATRNDAAHSPSTFNRPAAEVRTMIDGIRQFIARVP